MKKNKIIKWLIYTVLVGLIPILLRLIIYFVTVNDTVSLINASDFITFGLVLHISNINEIEHIQSRDFSWKTIQNGISLAFIIFYSALFCLVLLSENVNSIINSRNLDCCCLISSFVSLLLSFSIYYRISLLPTDEERK